jgi:lycopene cyclase domain-containing protein
VNSLYLWLNIGSIAVPLLYSFHPKLQLYKKFHWLLLSIMLTMGVFIPWDVIFTINGVWGFNSDYFLGFEIFSLPLEEWLFFICIPFACVFTHYALLLYFPNLKLSKVATKAISISLILIYLF